MDQSWACKYRDDPYFQSITRQMNAIPWLGVVIEMVVKKTMEPEGESEALQRQLFSKKC